jgi:hypothetical protein
MNSEDQSKTSPMLNLATANVTLDEKTAYLFIAKLHGKQRITLVPIKKVTLLVR